MAQPTAYTPATDFSTDEANAVSGRSTVRTANLDTEFSALKTTTDQIRTNLAILQRDDTKMRDQVVELHTLSASVLALINSNGWTKNAAGYPWLTATTYVVGNFVTNGNDGYLCIEAHTSGTFATDLAANKWVRITGVAYSDLASTTTGKGASLVGLEDAAGKFTATTVEAALPEIFTQLATDSDTKGAALVANAVQVINDYATLRGISPINGRRMRTKCKTVVTDGEAHTWRGVTGATPGTYAHDNVNVIVPLGGDGSAAWLIERVPYSGINQITSSRVLGRRSGTGGDVEQLTPGGGISVVGTSLEVDIANLSEDTSPDYDADLVMSRDVSAGIQKKIALKNLVKYSTQDIGASASGNYTIPLGTRCLICYGIGAGGGGGGGNSTLGGGGGGRGGAGMFYVVGNIGGMVLAYVTGVAGNPGAYNTSNGGRGTNGSPTTVTWPNGWVWTFGGAEGGIGATSTPPAGYASQQGTPGGNIAETGTVHPNVTGFGQFNLGAGIGQTGIGSVGGYGANMGDTGGGGRGGAAGNGGGTGTEAAQGGYLHFEAY